MEYRKINPGLQKRLSTMTVEDAKEYDFNKVFSKGIEVTVGCVSFNLFDHLGVFKGKNKGFHIWPFYHHDPQLGCMKEFHGVSAKVFKEKDKRRKF